MQNRTDLPYLAWRPWTHCMFSARLAAFRRQKHAAMASKVQWRAVHISSARQSGDYAADVSCGAVEWWLIVPLNRRMRRETTFREATQAREVREASDPRCHPVHATLSSNLPSLGK